MSSVHALEAVSKRFGFENPHVVANMSGIPAAFTGEMAASLLK